MTKRLFSLMLALMMLCAAMTITVNAAVDKLVGVQITGSGLLEETDGITSWYFPDITTVENVSEGGSTSTAYYSASMVFTDKECTLCLEDSPKAGQTYYFTTVLYTRSNQVNAITDANSTISIAGFCEGKVIEATTNTKGDITVLCSVTYGSNLRVDCSGTINYAVSGNAVTVNHANPCKLGYVNPEGKYVTLSANQNPDGTYTFTVPAGVTNVILFEKGDITGDGRINVGDVSKLYANVKQTSQLTGNTLFIADITGDDRINVGDVSKLYAHVKQPTLLTWDT